MVNELYSKKIHVWQGVTVRRKSNVERSKVKVVDGFDESSSSSGWRYDGLGCIKKELNKNLCIRIKTIKTRLDVGKFLSCPIDTYDYLEN